MANANRDISDRRAEYMMNFNLPSGLSSDIYLMPINFAETYPSNCMMLMAIL